MHTDELQSQNLNSDHGEAPNDDCVLEKECLFKEVQAVLDVDLQVSHRHGFPSILDYLKEQGEVDADIPNKQDSLKSQTGDNISANEAKVNDISTGARNSTGPTGGANTTTTTAAESPVRATTALESSSSSSMPQPQRRTLSQELGVLVEAAQATIEEEEEKNESEKHSLSGCDGGTLSTDQGQGQGEVDKIERMQEASATATDAAMSGESTLVQRSFDEQQDPNAGGEPQPSAEFAELKPPSKACKPAGCKVESLKEAFDFWDNCFEVLCHGLSDEASEEVLGSLANTLQEDSLSTAFSGVRSPETAANVLRFRLGQRLGYEIKNNNGKLGHMVEWDKSCQQECLLAASVEGSCLFGDINQFYRPELQETVLPQLMKKPGVAVQTLTPLILSGRAVVTSGNCLYHGKVCPMRTCQRHCAGTSCKPFSKRGTQLGTSDIDMISTLCWYALRRALQESDISQENVVDFPVSLANQLLGDLYFIDSIKLDPSSLGMPTARPRMFLRMRHRMKILSEVSPISRFALRFQRAVKYSWVECLVLASNI